MITVSFEKSTEPSKYERWVQFPDGQEIRQPSIEIPPDLPFQPAKYKWENKLSELPEEQVISGRSLADLALGKDGIAKFKELKRKRKWTGINFVESTKAAELASLPWELINIDGEFLSLNPRTPLIRSIEGYEAIDNLTYSRPVKMALISATPATQERLMIEEEQIKFALTIGHYMIQDKIQVHEIINCDRNKLSSALEQNRYDILYFTCHGAYKNRMGYICLEKGQEEETVSVPELARMILPDKIPNIVFLNCCQSGARDFNEIYNAFHDMGRELIKNGVPDVIATLTSVFDRDSQIFMRAFFSSLLFNFNVQEAVTRARDHLKSSSRNTFYQYIHLTKCLEKPVINFQETIEGEKRGQIYFSSISHPSRDRNFVSRHRVISELEALYLAGKKAITVYGIGGVGKTILSAMLEKRMLTHYDPALIATDTLWLDLRGSPSLGDLIGQIANIIHDAGNHVEAKNLREKADIKVLQICKILNETFGKKVFITLDNCESLLDREGKPKNPEMILFIIGLIAHTEGWKVLLTTREAFDLTLDGGTPFDFASYPVGSLTYTERAALLEHLLTGKDNIKNVEDADRLKIIKEVAGNPYELQLLTNLTSLSNFDTLIQETHKKAGEYAYLDYYAGRLKREELKLLQFI